MIRIYLLAFAAVFWRIDFEASPLTAGNLRRLSNFTPLNSIGDEGDFALYARHRR